MWGPSIQISEPLGRILTQTLTVCERAHCTSLMHCLQSPELAYVSFISTAIIKHLDTSKFKEEKIYAAYRFRLQWVSEGKLRQELETASPIHSQES